MYWNVWIFSNDFKSFENCYIFLNVSTLLFEMMHRQATTVHFWFVHTIFQPYTSRLLIHFHSLLSIHFHCFYYSSPSFFFFFRFMKEWLHLVDTYCKKKKNKKKQIGVFLMYSFLTRLWLFYFFINNIYPYIISQLPLLPRHYSSTTVQLRTEAGHAW